MSKKDNIYYSVKFIIIGNQYVGKTNLAYRFVKGEFSNEYLITIGIDYLSQNIQIEDKKFLLQIWDTAGSERFSSVTKGYFSNSACAIIVYDITDEKSFTSVKKWIEECKSYTNEKTHLVLVGNKCDLSDQRKISEEEGRALAIENNMSFFESSALNGKNVEEIFFDSINIINNNINENKYDFNDPTIGIKISEIEEKMEIHKIIKSSNNFILNSEEHSKKEKKKKCGC